MKRTNLTFLLTLGLLALWMPQPALACKVLANVQADDTVKVSAEEIQKCIERGEDAPFHLRANSGLNVKKTGESVGSLQIGFCGVDGTCANTARERTVEFVGGINPASNPDLNLPEIPWKNSQTAQIPCGAVSTLTEMALQTLWGNVGLQLPPVAKNLLNTQLTNLIGGLYKKSECADGTFWGLLNNVINLLLPSLGGSGNSGFAFNAGNSTFIAPTGAKLILPPKSVFVVDLSQGSANFSLPAGGHFTDSSGSIVNIVSGGNITFNSNGNVTTGSGQNFQVSPMGVVTLDPHGIVDVPQGKVIPVPPEGLLIPMGASNAPPDWAKPKI